MYVIGDCPKCGAEKQYGNALISNNIILRGCEKCDMRERVQLPPIKKKVIYLDQFFFSAAYREGGARFVAIAQKNKKVGMPTADCCSLFYNT